MSSKSLARVICAMQFWPVPGIQVTCSAVHLYCRTGPGCSTELSSCCCIPSCKGGVVLILC